MPYTGLPKGHGKPTSITVPALSTTGSYTVSRGASSTSGVTYVLQEATDSAFTAGVRKAYSGTGTSASITGRSFNETYYYRVKATKTGYTDSAWRTGENGCVVSPEAPTVSTTAVTSVTATTASSGGNATSDGGDSVTTKGVCWSTTVNPTTADNKTTDGTGTGEFTNSITGLTAGNTYYVRAYATNSAGTAYGDNVTFTTEHGDTLYVSNNGDCGETTPCYSSIQAALNSAEDGALIKVEEGIYKESPIKTTSCTFTISGGWNSTFAEQTGATSMYAQKGREAQSYGYIRTSWWRHSHSQHGR